MFFFLFLTKVFAQETEEVVVFTPHWEVGKIYPYEITKYKKSVEKGVVKQDIGKTYFANLEVLSKEDKVYTLKWSYDFDFESFGLPVEITSKLQNAFVNDIIYQTNEEGNEFQVINLDEITQKLLDFYDVLLVETSQKDENINQKREETKAVINKMLSNRQFVEGIMFKDLQLLHMAYSVEFEVPQSYQYQDERENPFGGENLETINVIDITKTSPSQYKMAVQSEIKEEDTKSFLKEYLKAFDTKDDEFENFLDNSTYSINDLTEIEYSSEKKIIIRAYNERIDRIKIKDDTSDSTEKLEIKLINK